MAVKDVKMVGKMPIEMKVRRPKATVSNRVAKSISSPQSSLGANTSGRIGGETFKSGNGYKSNPTYGRGLGIAQPSGKESAKRLVKKMAVSSAKATGRSFKKKLKKEL